MDPTKITLAVLSLTILIFSAILHEIMHGLVADKLGDPTARLAGRLTLNPLKHIDPFMSILLPLMLYFTSPIIFGGAKPVPVDPFNLKDGKKDLALVSLAGPLTNIIIAIVASFIFRIFFPGYSVFQILNAPGNLPEFIVGMIIYINLVLAVFNLIPIPPLDGSKILAMLLPDREAAAYLSISSIGIFILFFLLLVPIGDFSLMGFIFSIIASLLRLLGV